LPLGFVKLDRKYTAGSLTPAMRAELKAYGHYGDGSRFETGPFQVVGKLGRNVFPVPTGANSCFDPKSPVYVASCPQPRQTSVVHCVSGT